MRPEHTDAMQPAQDNQPRHSSSTRQFDTALKVTHRAKQSLCSPCLLGYGWN